jgi:hypothetical protein
MAAVMLARLILTLTVALTELHLSDRPANSKNNKKAGRCQCSFLPSVLLWLVMVGEPERASKKQQRCPPHKPGDSQGGRDYAEGSAAQHYSHSVSLALG